MKSAALVQLEQSSHSPKISFQSHQPPAKDSNGAGNLTIPVDSYGLLAILFAVAVKLFYPPLQRLFLAWISDDQDYDSQLNALLGRIMGITKSDRVFFLARTRNGEMGDRVTCTHEAVSAGHKRIGASIDRILVSRIFNDLSLVDQVLQADGGTVEPECKDYMAAQGVKTQYTHGFYLGGKNPAAYLTVQYSDSVTTENVLSVVDEAKNPLAEIHYLLRSRKDSVALIFYRKLLSGRIGESS